MARSLAAASENKSHPQPFIKRRRIFSSETPADANGIIELAVNDWEMAG
jgi:hypothetical protein